MRRLWDFDDEEIVRLLYPQRKPLPRRRKKSKSGVPGDRSEPGSPTTGLRRWGGSLGWKQRFWTEEENELLRRLYPHTLSAHLAQMLGRKVGAVHQHAALLGLRKLAEWKRSAEACKLRRSPEVGAPYRFQPGHVPANKGLRRPGYAPGRMGETQFKKGELNGSALQKWRPIGSTRYSKEGYLEFKSRERRGRHGNWKGVHTQLWEDKHGPIPKGYKLTFRDGDRTHITLDNLELISDAEMMRRNSVHNLPPELQLVIQLAGALKRKVRELISEGVNKSECECEGRG